MSNPEYESIGSPLTQVIEECSELIHILCKVDRFGWFDYHPDDPKKTPNAELVSREMEDVAKAIKKLKQHMKENVC